MEYSPQQGEALRRVRAWIAHPDKQVFRLFGYAGTGKTTLAKEVASWVQGHVYFATFTGKAALVLRKKGCPASTLHSLLYTPVEDPLTGERQFVLNPDSPVRTAALIVVDEVSMVGDDLAIDLLSFKRPVLVLGDPYQLPPIRGTGYFISGQPDYVLTEIHRQAADNPIIRISMKLRETGELPPRGAYGESTILRRQECRPEMVLAADQVICGRNQTRQVMNTRYRTLKGIEGAIPRVGERLICLRNNSGKGLLNGGMWDPLWVEYDTSLPDMPRLKMLMNNQDEPGTKRVEVLVPQAFFTYQEDSLDRWKRRSHDEFTFGYVITCHKAQGSEWPGVLIFDESAVFRDSAARWLYTAVTRASERVTIFI